MLINFQRGSFICNRVVTLGTPVSLSHDEILFCVMGTKYIIWNCISSAVFTSAKTHFVRKDHQKLGLQHACVFPSLCLTIYNERREIFQPNKAFHKHITGRTLC